LKETKEKIQKWIKQKVDGTNATGVVVGMSGGIDSSVVAVLCNEVVDTVGLIMPCNSDKQDEKDALSIIKQFGIKNCAVRLESTFTVLNASFHSFDEDISPHTALAQANLKSRLRMCTLYYYANAYDRLVIGTTNRTEMLLGYYTKGGDSQVDMEPIGALFKSDVRKLARELGIPDKIINKPPSAGLWEGQTDEGELGITYEELDRIFKMADDSMHKKVMPDICRL